MWPSRGTKMVLRRSKSTSVSYVPPIKTRIGSTHLESLIAPSAVDAGPDWLFITCRLTWLHIYCTVNTARINEESRFDPSLINTAAATGHSTQMYLHSVHFGVVVCKRCALPAVWLDRTATARNRWF